MAVILSEVTSNTASANMIVPVVISIATAAGVDPVEPALGATMGASLGFMLPVSTPCNAIVYGSGYIPLSKMMRYGIVLDVVGVVVIVTASRVTALSDNSARRSLAGRSPLALRHLAVPAAASPAVSMSAGSLNQAVAVTPTQRWRSPEKVFRPVAVVAKNLSVAPVRPIVPTTAITVRP